MTAEGDSRDIAILRLIGRCKICMYCGGREHDAHTYINVSFPCTV